MSGYSTSVKPAYLGFVQNSRDALLLINAVHNGKLQGVPRRPHERERDTLVKSGYIFVYEEGNSAIKRWTDGIAWSPSRIMGNFLLYRQLEKPFEPGEKKRAQKRAKAAQRQRDRRSSSGSNLSEHGKAVIARRASSAPAAIPRMSSEMERMLLGSLVDSYGFKHDGLIKKTISVHIGGAIYHMVAYYRISHFMKGHLGRPSQDRALSGQTLHIDLVTKQSFRQVVDAHGNELSHSSDSRHHEPVQDSDSHVQNDGEQFVADQFGIEDLGLGQLVAPDILAIDALLADEDLPTSNDHLPVSSGYASAGPSDQHYYQPAAPADVSADYVTIGNRYGPGTFESHQPGSFEYRPEDNRTAVTTSNLFADRTAPRTPGYGNSSPATFAAGTGSGANLGAYFPTTFQVDNQSNYSPSPTDGGRMPRGLSSNIYSDIDATQYATPSSWANDSGSYAAYRPQLAPAPYSPAPAVERPQLPSGPYTSATMLDHILLKPADYSPAPTQGQPSPLRYLKF